MVYITMFFFFQAEDGIRDVAVTGVQTCALPIFGLFLGKIYKGSHFMQERYEVRPGLWLASFSQYDFDGRKFFSGFSIHERAFYSNYRYIGPPKEALVAIRTELGRADLGKSGPDASDP